MDIIIQIIGAFGILASIISFQCKKHNSILFFRTLNEFIFAIQYFLLGAYTGMIVNLVGCVRNIIFSKQISKNKKTTFSIIIFSIMFVVFGFAVWQGPKSLLIIFAKVLSTLAYRILLQICSSRRCHTSFSRSQSKPIFLIIFIYSPLS